MDHKSFKDAFLAEVKLLCDKAMPGPWISNIEDLGFLSGSSIITTVPEGDLYLHDGTDNDQDFLAHARQDKPLLTKKLVS